MVTNKEDRRRLQAQCLELGLHFDTIEHLLNDTLIDEMGGESWDEVVLGAPGDLNKTPCIVNCFNQSGSTRRSYNYIYKFRI